jgi:murein DD-endopeptidase MepM/ murein hydrolase activator NlpD
MRKKRRLPDQALSGKVGSAMPDFIKSIGSKLVLRFGNRKTAVLSALTLFALVFLVGSVPLASVADAPRASAKAAAVEAAFEPGLPSAGGLPAQAPKGSAVPTGAVDHTGAKAAEDRGLYYTAYKVARGDTLSDIADAFNVTLDSVVSFNGIRNARSLQPGKILKVPSMSGILYTTKAGDSAASVAAANEVSADRVAEVNGIPVGQAIEKGRQIFLPDARLASFTLREISGDLFRWPARGWISSWYGWRRDPFSGNRSFHNGLDIGVDSGTPVCSAMDGVVAETGYNSGFGNYVIISHHAGWMSLYGHLQTILVKEGRRVSSGQRIALSGNTGYSTGPHLHFSVFKNGRTVNPFNVLH